MTRQQALALTLGISEEEILEDLHGTDLLYTKDHGTYLVLSKQAVEDYIVHGGFLVYGVDEILDAVNTDTKET